MDNPAMGVNHYENFPVASVLCPPALRAPIAAIYHFARTADDLADEGDAAPAERRLLLDTYEADLLRAVAGDTAGRWQPVFAPLARAFDSHRLPLAPLRDLLSAFRQDTANPIYAQRADLLDYCRRSANPIGRLLLHLVDLRDPRALAQSDAVCTALQLINFWQDLRVDLPRGRHYVTDADLAAHGVDRASLKMGADSDTTRALVRELVAWARGLMLQGAPLVQAMPGRMGWELRFVVQGGLRILEKIERGGCNALSHRPTLTAWDGPLLAWRAVTMNPGRSLRPLRSDPPDTGRTDP
jgi:hydroxysqualene synthase